MGGQFCNGHVNGHGSSPAANSPVVHHLNLCGALLQDIKDELWKMRDVVRAKDYVNMGELFEELGPVALSDAAADGDDAVRGLTRSACERRRWRWCGRRGRRGCRGRGR
jgi:hypothetical protein